MDSAPPAAVGPTKGAIACEENKEKSVRRRIGGKRERERERERMGDYLGLLPAEVADFLAALVSGIDKPISLSAEVEGVLPLDDLALIAANADGDVPCEREKVSKREKKRERRENLPSCLSFPSSSTLNFLGCSHVLEGKKKRKEKESQQKVRAEKAKAKAHL